MTARRVVAAVIAIGAVALFAVAALPVPRLHAFLSAGAGHSVTAGYVDDFRFRALVCGVVSLLIAIGTLRFPLRRSGLRTPEKPSLAAAIVIAIGAVARAALLFIPPRYDEVFTVTEFAVHSPLVFLTRYGFANNHLFHTLLVWLMRVVAGDRMWALRLPAFAAGVGVLYATYALARRFDDERTAVIATALAAVASPLVEYSAQARGYTILTLAFLLLFLIDDELVAAVVLAAGAWTIPTMVYAAAAWALWTLATQRNWRRVIRVGVAGGAFAFLLYVPILVASGLATITDNGVVRSLDLATFARELPKMLADTAHLWSLSFTLPVAIALAVAAFIAIVIRKPAAMPFACALVAALVMMVLTRKVPFARVWLFIVPLFAIAAASVLRAPRVIVLLGTAVFAWNAVRVTKRFDFYEDPAMLDVPAIARTIRALPPDARVLVTSPLDAPFRFYAPERIVEDRFDSDRASVRAAITAAPRRYFVASTQPGAMEMYDDLHLPYTLVPVARFPRAVLFELRSP